MARQRFCTIPHAVTGEPNFSLQRDIIGWSQIKPTSDTLRKKVVVRQSVPTNNGILAGADPVLNMWNSENDFEMKTHAEERKLHRLAKVHNSVDMWQGNETLYATQKGSRARNRLMEAVRCISDPQEIIKASLSRFQQDGAAAFKLSERSTMPPVLFAKDLAGGWTQIFNVPEIRTLNRHPVECDENRPHRSISDTEKFLSCNCDLNDPHDSKHDCAADD